MKKVKVLLDEDMHAILASSLRKRGFDVEHAQELGRKGKSDAEQLAYAVEKERCLITFNIIVKITYYYTTNMLALAVNIGELSFQNNCQLEKQCGGY